MLRKKTILSIVDADYLVYVGSSNTNYFTYISRSYADDVVSITRYIFDIRVVTSTGAIRKIHAKLLSCCQI